MFAPLDRDGAMKPHYFTGLEDPKTFLGKLGLTAALSLKLLESSPRRILHRSESL